MSKYSKTLQFFFILFLLTGCSSSITKDSNKVWRNDPTSISPFLGGVLNEGVRKLSPNEYWEVSEANLANTINQLQNKTNIDLSPITAKKYTNNQYTISLNTKPYLVRAVYANFKSPIEIYWDKKDKILYLTNSILGNINRELLSPRIINLEHKPKKVYVLIYSAL